MARYTKPSPKEKPGIFTKSHRPKSESRRNRRPKNRAVGRAASFRESMKGRVVPRPENAMKMIPVCYPCQTYHCTAYYFPFWTWPTLLIEFGKLVLPAVLKPGDLHLRRPRKGQFFWHAQVVAPDTRHWSWYFSMHRRCSLFLGMRGREPTALLLVWKRDVGQGYGGGCHSSDAGRLSEDARKTSYVRQTRTVASGQSDQWQSKQRRNFWIKKLFHWLIIDKKKREIVILCGEW